MIEISTYRPSTELLMMEEVKPALTITSSRREDSS